MTIGLFRAASSTIAGRKIKARRAGALRTWRPRGRNGEKCSCEAAISFFAWILLPRTQRCYFFPGVLGCKKPWSHLILKFECKNLEARYSVYYTIFWLQYFWSSYTRESIYVLPRKRAIHRIFSGSNHSNATVPAATSCVKQTCSLFF